MNYRIDAQGRRVSMERVKRSTEELKRLCHETLQNVLPAGTELEVIPIPPNSGVSWTWDLQLPEDLEFSAKLRDVRDYETILQKLRGTYDLEG